MSNFTLAQLKQIQATTTTYYDIQARYGMQPTPPEHPTRVVEDTRTVFVPSADSPTPDWLAMSKKMNMSIADTTDGIGIATGQKASLSNTQAANKILMEQTGMNLPPNYQPGFNNFGGPMVGPTGKQRDIYPVTSGRSKRVNPMGVPTPVVMDNRIGQSYNRNQFPGLAMVQNQAGWQNLANSPTFNKNL